MPVPVAGTGNKRSCRHAVFRRILPIFQNVQHTGMASRSASAPVDSGTACGGGAVSDIRFQISGLTPPAFCKKKFVTAFIYNVF